MDAKAVTQVFRVTDIDQHLVERCQANDKRAFAALVDKYKQSVFNYVYRMSGDQSEAEDLTQEVFIRLYTSLASFKSQSSVKTWIFRIAGNLCIDRFRRNQKHKAIAYSLDEPLSDSGEVGDGNRDIGDTSFEPGLAALRNEMADEIQSALEHLPEKLRSVVVLYDIEGLSYDEIAAIQGCPLGTVKSRLFNARMQLRKLLGAYIGS